jgi:hypothetical protein
MLKPVDLLYVQDSDSTAPPLRADYQQAARRLVPLINRVADGENLTVRQLADIGLDGWRLLDGLLNAPYETDPERINVC